MSSDSHLWDAAYQRDGPPPWDIGRPQPALAAVLTEQNAVDGSVLDAGCGTGEHALLAAANGAHVLGVDLSETAIAEARQKARRRGLAATFQVADILTTPLAGFDVVIDCGLFHVFDDDERPHYVAALRRALQDGGTCYLMCFSERQPGEWGPRRVRESELREAFADGWTIEQIQPAVFDINPVMGATTAEGWLATIRRSH